MDTASQKVFIVFNPKAGKEDEVAQVRAALAQYFVPPQWTLEIYETTGQEDVAALCRAACGQGATLVVSAGGDGTLVGVATGLVHSPVPLGILPLGTGNALARALLIPMKLDEAVKLLVSDHDIMEVDALQVGERCFFSNVSVGISAKMIDDTTTASKKRFGRLAYALAMFKQSSIFRRQWYTLTLDGQPRSIRATEMMISSAALQDGSALSIGPPDTLGDGQVEVYVVTARNLGGYLALVWGLIFRPGRPAKKLEHLTARLSVRIEATQRSALVQADGEMIGNTPVEITLIAKAVRVIMPKPAPAAAAK